MKELIIKKATLLEYDIEVNRYLTLAQIEAIARSAIRYNSYSERQTNIISLVMHFATTLSDEEIEEITVEKMVASGFADDVLDCVCNLSEVYDAIEYYESTQKVIKDMVKKISDPDFVNSIDPKLIEELKKIKR